MPVELTGVYTSIPKTIHKKMVAHCRREEIKQARYIADLIAADLKQREEKRKIERQKTK